jgi:hypothetical protein
MHHLYTILLIHAFLGILVLTCSEDTGSMRNNLLSRSIQSDKMKGQLSLNFMRPPRVLLQRSKSLQVILPIKSILQRSQSSIDVLYQTASHREADSQSSIARSARVMLTCLSVSGSTFSAARSRERSFKSYSHTNSNGYQQSAVQSNTGAFFRTDDDTDMWLEAVDSKESLAWVTARNAETLGVYHCGIC